MLQLVSSEAVFAAKGAGRSACVHEPSRNLRLIGFSGVA
jgi:hypothetical protein